uniref:Carboxylesterase type B domain-containing protein n=1 Tax=Acrobeloides nanus TaxID=290746 RepID=A0A914BZT4_9BILA
MYEQPYGIKDDDHLGWLKIYDDFFTGFHVGSVGKDVDYWLWSGNPNVYVYELTRPSRIGFNRFYNIPGWQPVPHALELYYIWMDWQIDGEWQYAIDHQLINQTDFDLLNFFGETWTNFAKTGIPHSDWKPTTQETYSYFEIDATRQMKDYYRQRDRIFFNKRLTQRCTQRIVSVIFGYGERESEVRSNLSITIPRDS